MREAKAPRWAEAVLQIVLPACDRESVLGDLLEEYREEVLATRGQVRAQLWYLRQVLVLLDGIRFGLMVGLACGGWMLVDTAIEPLAPDQPVAIGTVIGGVLVLLGLAGFLARQRGAPLTEAIKVGALAGVTAFAVFHCASLLRVNLFLDAVRHRSDWHGLLLRYDQSGFESLRVYANLVYIAETLPVAAAGAVAGTVAGVLGGLLGGAMGDPGRPVRRIGA